MTTFLRAVRCSSSWCLLLAVLAACSPAPPTPPPPSTAAPAVAGEVEATSFDGQPLLRPTLDPAAAAKQEALRAEAQAQIDADPANIDAWIWLGRRTGYLGRYREAIDVYTRALERFPNEPRLYRHRGHRYLTVRELDRAEADLERAAELMAGQPDSIEPDGLPNARNIPTSTLHANVWYHLGLARYLKRDFAGARDAYEHGLAVPGHVDMDIAMRYWLVLTLSRLGDTAARDAALASVKADAEVIESTDYLRLLLLFRGEGDPAALLAEAGAAGSELSFPTVGNGVGVWYLTHGDGARAKETFRRVVEKGPWAAFGAIAAERESVLRESTNS